MTGGIVPAAAFARRVMALAIVICLWPTAAAGSQVSGPHETVDSRMTTELAGAPSGFAYHGVYHAAGNPQGPPPYMRRMESYPPPGTRYDTSVPGVCSASDAQLALQGPAACPAASRLGGGSSVTAFLGRFPSTIQITVFNAPEQQIFLAQSPVFATVSRGAIHSDGSTEFAAPTCFPSSPLISQCPVDDVLQLESTIGVPPYTRLSGGRLRSYLTTAPSCPAGGAWIAPIRFWWADGSVDTVQTRQPCHPRPPAARPLHHPHVHHRARARRRHRSPPRLPGRGT